MTPDPVTPDPSTPVPTSGTPAGPDPQHLVPDEATLATIDRWLEYRLWHTRTPGAQVAVGVAGRPFFSRAYGFADLERAVPMTTEHLFRIASHSKTFAATLVLQLADAGRLGLEDPVGQHLPALVGDQALAGIRVRELLEHTSGLLRDGRDSDFWQLHRPFPDAGQLLEMAREGGLKSAPGEHFAYSNVGYSLLGLVVEAVTGQPFGEVARQRIIEPLGLTDTSADYRDDRAGDYAVGYSGLLTGPLRVPLHHMDTTGMSAATGFTSTATDLVRYFAAHAYGDQRLLDDRTKRLQQRLANPGDPRKADGSGYGWGMVVEPVDDEHLVGHSGGYPGHITQTLLDPRTGLVVSVLTNAMDGPATALAHGVVQLLADARRTAGEEGPSALALSRTGRYAGAWGVLDIAAVGGRLLRLSPASWTPVEDADVLAEGPDGALRIESGSGYGSVREPVTFEAGADGEVVGLRYGGGSMTPLPDLDGAPGYRLGGSGAA